MSRAIDIPLALLSGAATAFALYAMPEETLYGLTGGAQLEPAFVSAAGGVLAFALVWLVLRLLDRPKRRRPKQKLRRADAHPDAPPRAPLSARDLGEPAEEEAPAPTVRPRLVEPDSVPAWLQPAEAFETAEPLELSEPFVENAIEPEPEPIVEPESAAEAAPAPASQPVRPPVAEESIAALMRRLDRGLSRDSTPAAEAPQPSAAPAPELDRRLRSAIDELQRIARGA
jgi:hypothetical protein